MKLITLFFFIFCQIEPSLEVFPNPGNGSFNVTFKADSEGEVVLAVSDATGKYVFLKTVKDFKGELREKINLSAHPKGIYLFEVEWQKERQVKKVVLQ